MKKIKMKLSLMTLIILTLESNRILSTSNFRTLIFALFDFLWMCLLLNEDHLLLLST